MMMATLLPKLLDVFIGLLSLGLMGSKWFGPSNSLKAKDMMKIIEEKDREIEKLKIEIEGWKYHHDQLTNE